MWHARRGTALFDAGSFTIVVAITARDTDAAFYSIGMTFDGLRWGAGRSGSIHNGRREYARPRRGSVDPIEGIAALASSAAAWRSCARAMVKDSACSAW